MTRLIFEVDEQELDTLCQAVAVAVHEAEINIDALLLAIEKPESLEAKRDDTRTLRREESALVKTVTLQRKLIALKNRAKKGRLTFEDYAEGETIPEGTRHQNGDKTVFAA